MGLFHSPKIVTNGLVLALDAGNVKSLNQIFPQGQQEYTTPGSYTWTAPSDVTSVCVVCIGAGGAGGAYGGGGGSLAYKNNISVTPGQSYSVEVGASNTATNESGSLISTYAGLSSAFGTYAFGGRGGNIVSGTPGIGGNYDGGGEGGAGSGDFYQAGPGYKAGAGGGAGGYSGDGGDAGSGLSNGADGSGGGGGGGATGSSGRSFGGGGVGIYGEGANGSGGVPVYNGGTGIGGGGSGGEDSIVRGSGSTVTGGGLYGGGGGGGNNSAPVTTGSNSGGGAVRIIWGTGRSFPSTNTIDVTPQLAGSNNNNWTDISGNGNNATLTNGPTYSSDDGGALVFDGSDDYVDVGSTNIPAGPLTVSAWINLSSEVSIATIASSNGDWIFGTTSRKPFAYNYASAAQTTAPSGDALSIGVWYNVVMVQGSSLDVYINGSLSATNSDGTDVTATEDLDIGRRSGNNDRYHHGKIANLKIYSRALTAAEVLQNYNALKGRYA